MKTLESHSSLTLPETLPSNLDSSPENLVASGVEAADALGVTVIIGGGPAGLTAAYELGKIGARCIVLESDSDVGGISRTVEYKGYRFDIGGHRFYTKVQPVNDFWHEVMPEGEFLRRKRMSRIYYQKKFFHYPIQAKDALQNLGVLAAIAIVLSYARYRLFPIRPETSFEANICNRFGRRLFETFFQTYTEKVWGVPCSQITADWANQRIKGFGLGQAIKKAVFEKIRPTKTSAPVLTTLIDSFEYPRHGPGQLWRRVADLIDEHGNEVRMQTRARRILHDNTRVLAVEAETKNGETERLEGEHFISSMPVRTLIHSFDPPAPQRVLDAANTLRYRDFLTVALVLDCPHVFDDNWIYIHEPNVKMGRIQNFKNWSEEMVPDESKTCLGLEYFCFEGDGLWNLSDDELIELGKRELETLGLAKAAQIEDGCVVRQKKAYPVYDADYQGALSVIREWLQTLPNLQLVGRNGMHRYNNQDHSMLTAMLAVHNICGESFDLWSINSDEDQEYGEELPADTHHSDYNHSARSSTRMRSQLNQTQPRVPSTISTTKHP